MLANAFHSVTGNTSRLSLPAVRRVIVVLVDGLGAENLRAHRAHARHISALRHRVCLGNFPSTTASALSTFTTTRDPGETGMVGYAVRNPESGLLVNQLSGLDGIDVTGWQPAPTLWEQNPEVPAVVISNERYRHSGLTRAILRGAPYVGANSHAERIQRVSEFMRSNGDGVAYVYIPELDQAAHQFGVESSQWIRRLEDLDGFVAELSRLLGPRDGLVLTADHGVIDVPVSRHIVIPAGSDLVGDVVVGGEPRFLHLYADRSVDKLAQAWRDAEGHRSWVATRDEAITAGWFGTVVPAHVERIGDVLVTPRRNDVYYDERTATAQSMAMIGQHGGLSRTETHVPIVFGGKFA